MLVENILCVILAFAGQFSCNTSEKEIAQDANKVMECVDLKRKSSDISDLITREIDVTIESENPEDALNAYDRIISALELEIGRLEDCRADVSEEAMTRMYMSGYYEYKFELQLLESFIKSSIQGEKVMMTKESEEFIYEIALDIRNID